MRELLWDSFPTFHPIPSSTPKRNTGVRWHIVGQASAMKMPGGPLPLFLSPRDFPVSRYLSFFYCTSVGDHGKRGKILQREKKENNFTIFPT